MRPRRAVYKPRVLAFHNRFTAQMTRLLLCNNLFTIVTTEHVQRPTYTTVAQFPTQTTATGAITGQNEVGRPSNDFWFLSDRLKLTARM